MRIRKLSNIILLGLVFFISVSACAQKGKEADKRPKEPEKSEAAAAIAAAKLPHPASFLNDKSGLFSESDKAETERVLLELRDKAQIDLAIAVVDTTDGKDIFNYSLAMARDRKVGAKNGGALLVVAIKDRKWHIQIDQRLQTDLSNEEVKNIGEVMIPDFREDKYVEGIKKCVEKMISVLAAKQHFEPIKFTTDVKKQ
jgi:uncharacterized protein